jgi:hypothetical protein
MAAVLVVLRGFKALLRDQKLPMSSVDPRMVMQAAPPIEMSAYAVLKSRSFQLLSGKTRQISLPIIVLNI